MPKRGEWLDENNLDTAPSTSHGEPEETQCSLCGHIYVPCSQSLSLSLESELTRSCFPHECSLLLKSIQNIMPENDGPLFLTRQGNAVDFVFSLLLKLHQRTFLEIMRIKRW
jgi:hypothetical protein